MPIISKTVKGFVLSIVMLGITPPLMAEKKTIFTLNDLENQLDQWDGKRVTIRAYAVNDAGGFLYLRTGMIKSDGVVTCEDQVKDQYEIFTKRPKKKWASNFSLKVSAKNDNEKNTRFRNEIIVSVIYKKNPTGDDIYPDGGDEGIHYFFDPKGLKFTGKKCKSY